MRELAEGALLRLIETEARGKKNTGKMPARRKSICADLE
jgi:hypothetical protein